MNNYFRVFGILFLCTTLLGCAFLEDYLRKRNLELLINFSRNEDYSINLANLESEKAFVYSNLSDPWVDFPPNSELSLNVSKRLIQDHLNQLIPENGLSFAISKPNDKNNAKSIRGDSILLNQAKDIEFSDEAQIITANFDGFINLKTYFLSPTFKIDTLKIQIKPSVATVEVRDPDTENAASNIIAFTLNLAVTEIKIDTFNENMNKSILHLLNREILRQFSTKPALEDMCKEIQEQLNMDCDSAVLVADELLSEDMIILEREFQRSLGGFESYFAPREEFRDFGRSRGLIGNIRFTDESIELKLAFLESN